MKTKGLAVAEEQRGEISKAWRETAESDTGRRWGISDGREIAGYGSVEEREVRPGDGGRVGEETVTYTARKKTWAEAGGQPPTLNEGGT